MEMDDRSTDREKECIRDDHLPVRSADSGVHTLLNRMERHRSGPEPVKSAFRSALKAPVHQNARRNQILQPQDHRADPAPQFPVTTRDASSENNRDEEPELIEQKLRRH